MRLGGTEITVGAAARLACLLHDNGEHALALHLGHAIDHLHNQVTLDVRERDTVLRLLVDCPPDLADLRASLLADQIGHVQSR